VYRSTIDFLRTGRYLRRQIKFFDFRMHPENINRRTSLKKLITDKKDSRGWENRFSFSIKDLPGDVDNKVVPLQRSHPVHGPSLGVAFADVPPEAPFGLARLAGKGPLLNPV
jgi:hypothetical protein